MNFVMPPLLPVDLNERIVADKTECTVVGWNPPSSGNLSLQKNL